jgi:STELLO glycosyltransferase-like protein
MGMTGTWRGFVAQRIAWTNNWSVLFHESTVVHERNEHVWLRDFQDELPGYLNNKEISVALGNLPLQPGLDKLNDNLRLCYLDFVRMDLIGEAELDLLEAWIADIEQITNRAISKTQRTFLCYQSMKISRRVSRLWCLSLTNRPPWRRSCTN